MIVIQDRLLWDINESEQSHIMRNAYAFIKDIIIEHQLNNITKENMQSERECPSLSLLTCCVYVRVDFSDVGADMRTDISTARRSKDIHGKSAVSMLVQLSRDGDCHV